MFDSYGRPRGAAIVVYDDGCKSLRVSGAVPTFARYFRARAFKLLLTCLRSPRSGTVNDSPGRALSRR
jgi:hypothetical protein